MHNKLQYWIWRDHITGFQLHRLQEIDSACALILDGKGLFAWLHHKSNWGDSNTFPQHSGQKTAQQPGERWAATAGAGLFWELHCDQKITRMSQCFLALPFTWRRGPLNNMIIVKGTCLFRGPFRRCHCPMNSLNSVKTTTLLQTLTEQALISLPSSQRWLNNVEGTVAFLSPVPGTGWLQSFWQHPNVIFSVLTG